MNLTVIETNKNTLSGYLNQHQNLFDIIKQEQQEEFKSNFLELASNDYLVSKVLPTELVKFCVSVTLMGLNINPAYKEVYIVPYNTEVRKNAPKIMLPQAIIPLNGIQERANKNGFFLHIYEVYKFDDGKIISEKEMSREYQIQLDTTNSNWFNKHFVGFDVVLTDLRKQIPEQIKFVDAKYLKEVTMTIKSQSYKAQTYRHKAARRAFGDFNIPRDRKDNVLVELEHLNDTTLEAKNIGKLNHNTTTITQETIATAIEDGYIVVTSDTYGKSEELKSLGYSLIGSKWKKLVDKQQPKSISPAKELSLYLMKKGIKKEDLGRFVKDVLGTSSSDIEGIKKALANKNTLDSMVETFLSEPTIEIV